MYQSVFAGMGAVGPNGAASVSTSAAYPSSTASFAADAVVNGFGRLSAVGVDSPLHSPLMGPTVALDHLSLNTSAYSAAHHFNFPAFISAAAVSPQSDDSAATAADQRSPATMQLIAASADPLNPYCAICGDRATGKHYGAHSCDGCKGFFRRTIRRKQTYTCRFTRDCVIDKDHRNVCRHCRFEKCLIAGMRQDAVQNERDRINTKRQSRADSTTALDGSGRKVSRQDDDGDARGSPPFEQLFIDTLLRSEAVCKQLRTSVITRTSDQLPSPPNRSANVAAEAPADRQARRAAVQPAAPATGAASGQYKLATMTDLTESMHQQLLLMVEWAKTLPPFLELNMEDQIALLRNYSAQHLLVCVAYRSKHLSDTLYLTNETVIPRDHPAEIPDINIIFRHVISRVMDELVGQMVQMRMDESEYVSLKAIIFFNPIAKGAERSSERIRITRQRILLELERYVGRRQVSGDADPCRFANLLLLLPSVQAVAQSLVEDVQLASLFGMAQFDALMQELMLHNMDTGCHS